jgi:hypothetical protein
MKGEIITVYVVFRAGIPSEDRHDILGVFREYPPSYANVHKRSAFRPEGEDRVFLLSNLPPFELS